MALADLERVAELPPARVVAAAMLAQLNLGASNCLLTRDCGTAPCEAAIGVLSAAAAFQLPGAILVFGGRDQGERIVRRALTPRQLAFRQLLTDGYSQADATAAVVHALNTRSVDRMPRSLQQIAQRELLGGESGASDESTLWNDLARALSGVGDASLFGLLSRARARAGAAGGGGGGGAAGGAAAAAPAMAAASATSGGADERVVAVVQGSAGYGVAAPPPRARSCRLFDAAGEEDAVPWQHDVCVGTDVFALRLTVAPDMRHLVHPDVRDVEPAVRVRMADATTRYPDAGGALEARELLRAAVAAFGSSRPALNTAAEAVETASGSSTPLASLSREVLNTVAASVAAAVALQVQSLPAGRIDDGNERMRYKAAREALPVLAMDAAAERRGRLARHALRLHVVGEWECVPAATLTGGPQPVPTVPNSHHMAAMTALAAGSLERLTASGEGATPGVGDMELVLPPPDESVPTDDDADAPPPPRRLRVLRDLLRRRSPALALMLPPRAWDGGDGDSGVEGGSDELPLWEGMADGVAVCLLHYLYTDTLHPVMTPDDALALLVAAQQYQLPRLGRLLEARLIRELSDDNVCGLLAFAHAYGADAPEVVAALEPGGSSDGGGGGDSGGGGGGGAAAGAGAGEEEAGADSASAVADSAPAPPRAAPTTPPAASRMVGAQMWGALHSACVSYILRHFAALRDTEDFAALDPALAAQLAWRWSSTAHAYQFDTRSGGGAAAAASGGTVD